MSTKWQAITVDVSDQYSKADREAIAFDIIEFIRKRTEQGLDWQGKSWRGKADQYTKGYENSLDFKIAGKSKGQTPDLTLSGDMLGALDLLKNKKGQLTIGYVNGSPENARADGNIRGTYGQSKPISGKARDFLGITDNDLQTILDNYPIEDTSGG